MKKVGNVWYGIILGGALPFIIVGIINLLLVLWGKYLDENIYQAALLLGVGVNALFIRYFFRKNKDFTSRGIMVSSMLIFIYWVIRFTLLDK